MVNSGKTDWDSEVGVKIKAAVGNGLQRPEDAWVTTAEDAEAVYGAGHVYVRRISPQNPEYTVAQIRPGERSKVYDGLCVSIQRIDPSPQGVAWELLGRGTGSFEQYQGTTPPEGVPVHGHQSDAEGGSLDAAAIGSGTLDDARLSANVMLLDGVQTVTGAKTFGTGDLIADTADLNTPDIDGGTITGATELTVVSTTQGSIPMPVMTEAQRDAIASPVEGMWVFNSTSNTPDYYDGADWVAVGTASLTSPVAIADGGTGQTTATAAFNALAPASPAKGDMLVFNGTDWVKHTAGTNGQFITYDSAEATGIKNVTLTPSDLGTLVVTKTTLRIAKTLYESTLGSDASFDISSIDQTYTDLEIVLLLRSSAAVSQDNGYLFFNNDQTLTNYQVQSINNASNTTANAGYADSPLVAPIPGTSALADNWLALRIFIPSYADTTKHKSALTHGVARYAATNTERVDLRHINWESASAINRIQIQTDNDPTDLFLTGSRITIIGHKNMDVVTDVELV